MKQKITPEVFTQKNDKFQNLEKILKLHSEIKNLKSFDVKAISMCFLLDVTGSMKPYVEQVKKQIKFIIDRIDSQQTQKMDILLSIIAYRDRKDKKSFEVLKFTKNSDEFQQFLDQISFSGGGDTCEDVKKGLEEVIKLGWRDEHLNLLIWIADSPCHGKQFHTQNENDDYPDDNSEDIQDLLREISEQNIDVYFYKINDTTDTMISLFKEYIEINDKNLREYNFKEESFSQNVSQNYTSSSQSQSFSQFIRFTNNLKKSKQLEQALELKNKIKKYQKIVIEHESLGKKINNLHENIENIDQKNVQSSDIKNFDELQKVFKKFRVFKFKLNNDLNKIDIVSEEVKHYEVTKDVIGQGSFKDVYLAEDEETGAIYALKKFKDSNKFDFDNLITEYYIFLLSKEIRTSFLDDLKNKTNPEHRKKLKICIDDLWIIQDEETQEYFIQEIFKIGFQKFICTNGRSLENQELFQSLLHYSFEYSDYNYILSDIQGFGNTLNDISIHNQKFIDGFEHVNDKQQLLEQFLFEKQINMQKLDINFPIYPNLGDLGIVLFFNQHKCSSYCQSLNLKTIDGYHQYLQKRSKKCISIETIYENSEYQNDFEDNYSSTATTESSRGRTRQRQNSPVTAVKKCNRSKEQKDQYNQYLKMASQ